MKSFSFFLLIIIIIFPYSLIGHHAMEYIEMESYSTAMKGEFIFHLHFDYMVDDDSNPALDHWEYTPGISYGISNRLMFDVHTHFAKFGNDHIVENLKNSFPVNGPSPFMEAVAFAVQYRITENLPVNFAVSATYEIPFSRSRELINGDNVIEGMLIASYEFGQHSNLTVNLMAGMDGDTTYSGWALGVKTPLSGNPHGIAGGLEFLGDFSGNASVLAGIYFPIASENIVFKTGLEFGTGSSRANSTLMYRF